MSRPHCIRSLTLGRYCLRLLLCVLLTCRSVVPLTLDLAKGPCVVVLGAAASMCGAVHGPYRALCRLILTPVLPHIRRPNPRAEVLPRGGWCECNSGAHPPPAVRCTQRRLPRNTAPTSRRQPTTADAPHAWQCAGSGQQQQHGCSV
jgi:hypothetical protein